MEIKYFRSFIQPLWLLKDSNAIQAVRTSHHRPTMWAYMSLKEKIIQRTSGVIQRKYIFKSITATCRLRVRLRLSMQYQGWAELQQSSVNSGQIFNWFMFSFWLHIKSRASTINSNVCPWLSSWLTSYSAGQSEAAKAWDSQLSQNAFSTNQRFRGKVKSCSNFCCRTVNILLYLIMY